MTPTELDTLIADLEVKLKAATPDDTDHSHSHSLFVRCFECKMFGTPMPNETECGNCGSKDTAKYYPICCVQNARHALPALLQAIRELRAGLDEVAQKYIDVAGKYSEAADRVLAAETRLAEAEGVIRFYAESGNYIRNEVIKDFAPGFGHYVDDVSKVSEDGGDSARAYLEKYGNIK